MLAPTQLTPANEDYPAWGASWLAAFRIIGTIAGACDLVRPRINRLTFYRYRDGCEQFRKDYEAERENICDDYEAMLRTMALQGRSVRALQTMLRSFHPERWGSTPTPPPPQVASTQYSAMRDKLRDKIAAQRQAREGGMLMPAPDLALASDDEVIDVDSR